jgi:hypothetical protein
MLSYKIYCHTYVTLHPRCQACVCIYSSCGRWVFPPLLYSFPPPPLSQAFLLLITGRCCCSCQPPCLFTVQVASGSSLLSCGVFLPPPLSPAFPLLVAGRVPCPHSCQRLSGLPGLFIYSPRKGSLPPIFSAQGTPPCFPYVFIAYYSVSLFSPGGGQSVQGAMLLWPKLVCGSTAYRKAHLVHVFPSHLGAGYWQPGGPPGFSI